MINVRKKKSKKGRCAVCSVRRDREGGALRGLQILLGYWTFSTFEDIS